MISKPFPFDRQDLLRLASISRALTHRKEHPDLYHLTEDQMLENNETLDLVDELLKRAGFVPLMSVYKQGVDEE